MNAALQLHALAMTAAPAGGNFELLKSTDWRMAGGDDVGVSGGAKVKVGAGYTGLNLRRVSSPDIGFDLQGGNVQVGVGVGLSIKGLEGLAKGVKALLDKLGHVTVGAGVPSGTLGPLYFGIGRSSVLDRPHFDNSQWFYAAVGGMSAVMGVDGGIICLLSSPWDRIESGFESYIAQAASTNSATQGAYAAYYLLKNTVAWGFFGGMSIGVGIEVGAFGKVIQMVSCTPVK